MNDTTTSYHLSSTYSMPQVISSVLQELSQPHKIDRALLQMKSQDIQHVGVKTQDSSLGFSPLFFTVSWRVSGSPRDESTAPGKWGQEEATGGGRMRRGKGRREGAGKTITLQQRKTFVKNSGPRERQGLKSERSTCGNIRNCSWDSLFLTLGG